MEKANGPYVLERLGSTDKRLLALDDSAHEITLDHGRERIMVEVWDFVRRLAGARAPAPSCDRLRARPAPRRVPTMPKLAAAIKAVPGLAPASGGCEHAVGH